MKQHKHYTFVAFDEYDDKEKKSIRWGVTLSTQGALSESEALKEVRKLAKRKYYFLQKAWNCDSCDAQQELVGVLKQYLDK